jgi:hypothetical protein
MLRYLGARARSLALEADRRDATCRAQLEHGQRRTAGEPEVLVDVDRGRDPRGPRQVHHEGRRLVSRGLFSDVKVGTEDAGAEDPPRIENALAWIWRVYRPGCGCDPDDGDRGDDGQRTTAPWVIGRSGSTCTRARRRAARGCRRSAPCRWPRSTPGRRDRSLRVDWCPRGAPNTVGKNCTSDCEICVRWCNLRGQVDF